jgi:hypothetical protein
MRTRRSATVALVMITALLGALLLSTTASTKGVSSVKLFTDLNGAEEFPVLGDPDGSGDAHLTLYPSLDIVCYTLRVQGIAPATLAHIHQGAAGTAGGVVVDFKAPKSGVSTGCTRPKAGFEGIIADIAENPSGFYVNVHNADFGGGAVRGQLGD